MNIRNKNKGEKSFKHTEGLLKSYEFDQEGIKKIFGQILINRSDQEFFITTLQR